MEKKAMEAFNKEKFSRSSWRLSSLTNQPTSQPTNKQAKRANELRRITVISLLAAN